MNANANIVDLVKGNSTLVRPRFSPGLLLRDDDLKVGVDYTRELSRLLFQSLFGCGVVCGLKVSAEPECGKLIVTIDKGVALNCIGDPIHVPEQVKIKVDPTCGRPTPKEMWVILCRTEKCCAPRTAVCGCEEEDSASVCTREHDGFEIRLVKEKPGDCACICEPSGSPSDDAGSCWCVNPCSDCYKDHYAGICGCDCCDGECVVLALLTDQSGEQSASKENPWLVDHRVRRFVRPVLMRDPIVYGHEKLCTASETAQVKSAATAAMKEGSGPSQSATAKRTAYAAAKTSKAKAGARPAAVKASAPKQS